MFLSLKRIGELWSKEVKLPIDEIDLNGKGPFTLRLVIFDNDKKEVRFEDYEMTDKTVYDWNYIGNSKGQESMDKLTTNELRYILGFKKNGEVEEDSKQILKKAQAIPKVGKILEEVSRWYSPEEWKNKVDKKMFDAKLFSIVVIKGGERMELAKFKEYEDYLLSQKKEKKKGTEKVKGIKCQICGENDAMDNPRYPGGTLLKVYITDKKGFISGISDSVEARLRTYAVCNNCRNLMVLGSSFVKNKMRANIGKLSVYVVPTLSESAPENILSRIKVEGKGWIVSFKNIEKAEEEIKDEAEYSDWIYSVSLVWASIQQSKFAVTKVMYDVSVPRLLEIKRVSRRVEEELSIKALTGQVLDIVSLYSVSPVKESSNRPMATQFLDMLSSLMEGYPIDENYVYSSFLQELRCIRTGTCQNFLSKRLSLEEASLLATGFIKVFKTLSIMGTNQMVEETKSSDPLEYAKKLGLAKGQTGLFLLGVVTSSVGLEQYKKGDKKKAILNKIDFEGMDLSDVKIYASRLMEYLRYYDVLRSNEKLMGDALSMINEDPSSLSSPQENVFWILSGYSWQTRNMIVKGDIKEEGEENE